MKLSITILAGIIAAGCAHEAHDDHMLSHSHDHVHGEGITERCGTEHDDDEALRATELAERFHAKVCSQKSLENINMCLDINDPRKRNEVVIPTWYHIIHDGNTGNLTDAQVQAQFEQVNKDFAGQENPGSGAARMNISFELAGVTRTNNGLWFSDLDRYETDIKRALAVDNTRNFNQYFGNFRAGLLGFCYFPNSFAESSFRHGCMNLYSSIPGGSSTGYNEGKTTTHETGHGIGLFHTFQGGCFGNGDQVADTCNQASGTSGCPASRNSCPNNGCNDPIHNYMDYSTDNCMYEFTPGQSARADQQLSTFRPSLYLSKDEIQAIKNVVPDAWDEAKSFQVESEAKYAAKRAAKGFN
jgi:hypothetical protein